MIQTDQNFEIRRSRANIVGKIDTCFLVCGTLTIIGILPIGVVALFTQYHRISDGVLVYLVYSALVLLAFVAVEFYATNRLVKASSKDNDITAEKSLSWCHIWFPLNIFFLVIGILIMLLAFQPKVVLVLIIGVPVRVYMLCIVKEYMDALEERVSENRPHNDLHLHAIFGGLGKNKFRKEFV